MSNWVMRYYSGGQTIADGGSTPPLCDVGGNLLIKSSAAGTAGSPSTAVLSVQGVTSGTPVIVGGAVASGAADSGNPVKVGGVFNTTPATLTNGQRGDLQLTAAQQLIVSNMGLRATGADGVSNTSTVAKFNDSAGNPTNGLQIFPLGFNGATWDRSRGDTGGTVNQPFALASSRWNYAAAAGGITSATSVTIAAAAGASVKNYVTGFDVSWTALTASTEVVFRDGAAGTVKERIVLPAGSSGTFSRTFNCPIAGTANTLMEVAVLTNPVAGAININVSGYTGA